MTVVKSMWSAPAAVSSSTAALAKSTVEGAILIVSLKKKNEIRFMINID